MRLLKDSYICKLCDKSFKRTCDLSKHLKQHDITPIQYTVVYLLNNNIPTCLCGCNKPVKVFNFQYNEYILGHTGGGSWQNLYDKDSIEYKKIIQKISLSVKDFLDKNPISLTDQQRKIRSDNLKRILSDPEVKNSRIQKMKNTKKIQSQSGILSKTHWSNNKSPEEKEEILRRMGAKISESRLNKNIEAWNKGLTKNDPRVKKYSNENHYRFYKDKEEFYPVLFKNKQYRNFLLSRQNNKCIITNSELDLCLHHIDENKLNCRPENLIYVKRSIHMKIHNSKQYQRIFNEKADDFLSKVDSEFLNKYNIYY